jgi:transcriptional regulator with XRE-family HTH domain
MSNRNWTDEQIEKRLGISIATWDKIELSSIGLLVLITLRETMDVVGSNGLFGYGKSKKLQKYSRLGFERDTWSNINVLSTILGAGLLLKGAVDTVEAKSGIMATMLKPKTLGGANLQGFNRNRII